MSRRFDRIRRCAGGALTAAVLAMGMSAAAQKPVVDPLRPGPLPAPKVKVNKTTPKVAPPRTTLSFSARPTAAEIFAARAFKEPIVPVGGTPSDGERHRTR